MVYVWGYIEMNVLYTYTTIRQCGLRYCSEGADEEMTSSRGRDFVWFISRNRHNNARVRLLISKEPLMQNMFPDSIVLFTPVYLH